MSVFFWIGLKFGLGFYCAIIFTDLVTKIVMKIINKRKGGEGMKAKVKASGAEIEVQLTKLDTQFGIQEFTDKNGEKYQFYELEFLPDTPEEVTVEGYVARDRNNDLSLYKTYPERQSNFGYWRDGNDEIELPKESFPSVTWQSEPKRVKITITPMEE